MSLVSLNITAFILVLCKFARKKLMHYISGLTRKERKITRGINTLNRLLPDMCEAAGRKRKSVHCFRVTCASSLFNAGVDRKLIHDRSGHRSDALMKYEKANEKVQTKVSAILGPKLESSTVSATISVDSSSESASRKVEKVSQNVDMDTTPVCFSDFKKCTVPI